MIEMIDLAQIKQWVQSQNLRLAERGIRVVGTSETERHKPSVCIDYEGEEAIGRILIWTSGEIDMEVLDRESETFRYLHHITIEDLQASPLADAVQEFARSMESKE